MVSWCSGIDNYNVCFCKDFALHFLHVFEWGFFGLFLVCFGLVYFSTYAAVVFFVFISPICGRQCFERFVNSNDKG